MFLIRLIMKDAIQVRLDETMTLLFYLDGLVHALYQGCVVGSVRSAGQ